MGRVAAIDYGLARIGLALSDELKMIAAPLETIQASKKSEESVRLVLEALKGSRIDAIVVGIPLMMNGSVGFLADEVRMFIEKLRGATDIPVIEWDERLTSVQADRSLREGKMSRKKRAKKVDAVAAVIILQSYLDHLAIRRELQ